MILPRQRSFSIHLAQTKLQRTTNRNLLSAKAISAPWKRGQHPKQNEVNAAVDTNATVYYDEGPQASIMTLSEEGKAQSEFLESNRGIVGS
jgi:hypothetical protein